MKQNKTLKAWAIINNNYKIPICKINAYVGYAGEKKRYLINPWLVFGTRKQAEYHNELTKKWFRRKNPFENYPAKIIRIEIKTYEK